MQYNVGGIDDFIKFTVYPPRCSFGKDGVDVLGIVGLERIRN